MERARIEGLYQSSLLPRLEQLETRRKALRNTVIGGVALGAAGAGSCVTAFDPPQSLARLEAWRYGPFVLALAAIACFGLAVSRFLVPGVLGYLNYRARFKREVVAEVVRALRPGTRFFADRQLPRLVYDEAGLFRGDLDRYTGDDLLQGKVGETPFEAGEVEASYQKGSSKNRTTVSVFHGLMCRVALDRDLSGRTLLKPPGQMPPPGLDDGSLQPLATGDAAFDAAFATWTSDPAASLSLLDDGLRRRLVTLREEVREPLHLSLSGGVATLAVHYGRRLFEPSLAGRPGLEAVEAMAAPLAAVDQAVRALGLDGRRARPADADFFVGPTEASGLEAVTAAGDADLADLAQALEAPAAAAALPVAPPAREPLVRLSSLGGETLAEYPVGLALVVVVLLWLASSLLALVCLAAWAQPALAAELARVLAAWRPALADPAGLLETHPTGLLLGSLALAWLFSSILRHRPASVAIGPEGVRVRRVFRPWAFALPLAAVRRVETSGRSVYLVRADRSFLRGFVAVSPLLPDEAEARWLAQELGAALARSGWRPPARAAGKGPLSP